MGAGCQGRGGPFNPTHNLLGGEMGWRLSSVTSVQSFNQYCPCKEASIKAQEDGVQKASGLVNVWKVLNLRRACELSTSPGAPCSMCVSHLAAPEWYSFILNL